MRWRIRSGWNGLWQSSLKEGRQVKEAELCAFLATRFAKWQLPDAFVFVDELPHTSTGKLLKSKLRQQFGDWQWEQVPAGQGTA